MNISREDIEHVASLSMLELSEQEIERYTKDMQNIVTFAEQVQEVNTDNITESAYALDAYNVFRKDEVKDSIDRELIMNNAPSSNGIAFLIPPMV
jgi:aspartyl-tRNA(Asn)/glutamyl-tRNA(Gln) amidotransferase subunit C